MLVLTVKCALVSFLINAIYLIGQNATLFQSTVQNAWLVSLFLDRLKYSENESV